MKHIKRIFIMALALVTLVISPMQALAASQVEYISEIRIGYGDEGKAALEAEGFTVWTDLNANEGGVGSAVWVGYTTTDDPDEAITDVALMNMQGDYSFDAYTKEVQELNRQVTVQLANFAASIEEFQKNYAAGSIYAEEALKIMNCFYEDDTLDSNGKPVGVGDLMLDANTPEETLHRIFLEGNTEAVTAIEQGLALGCIEIGDETVLSRLEEAEYPDELDASLTTARGNLLVAFEDFNSTAVGLQEFYEKASAYEGGVEGFLAQQTLSEAERSAYVIKLTQYALLADTDFGETGMTLLDFALLDKEEENENGDVLENEYLEMLAKSMTSGQLGLVANVGIMTILTNSQAGADTESAKTAYANLDKENDLSTTVSVYHGVDRDLFANTDGIALTGDALREKASNEGSDFGKDAGADKTMAIVMSAAAAAAMTAGIVATVVGAKIILYSQQFINVVAVSSAGQVGQTLAYTLASKTGLLSCCSTVGTAMSVAGTIVTILGAVAILAGVVLTIFSILKWLEKPETRVVEYTEIPRVLVERPAGQRSFIAYYAARLAGAAEDETDSLALYGDLNGLNKQDDWLVLYYTKNSTVGTPLTTEMLINDTGLIKENQAGEYSAVHMFGSSAAANLNQYNTGSDAEAIYVFFRTDTSGGGQEGSVFASGSVTMSLITFLVGAGLSAAVTYGLTKKKKTAAA